MDKMNVLFVVLAQLPMTRFISSKFIWQFAIRFEAEDRFKINLESKLAQLLAVMHPRSGQRYSNANQFCSLLQRDPGAHLQELSVQHFSPLLNSHFIWTTTTNPSPKEKWNIFVSLLAIQTGHRCMWSNKPSQYKLI